MGMLPPTLATARGAFGVLRFGAGLVGSGAGSVRQGGVVMQQLPGHAGRTSALTLCRSGGEELQEGRQCQCGHSSLLGSAVLGAGRYRVPALQSVARQQVVRLARDASSHSPTVRLNDVAHLLPVQLWEDPRHGQRHALQAKALGARHSLHGSSGDVRRVCTAWLIAGHVQSARRSTQAWNLAQVQATLPSACEAAAVQLRLRRCHCCHLECAQRALSRGQAYLDH